MAAVAEGTEDVAGTSGQNRSTVAGSLVVGGSWVERARKSAEVGSLNSVGSEEDAAGRIVASMDRDYKDLSTRVGRECTLHLTGCGVSKHPFCPMDIPARSGRSV